MNLGIVHETLPQPRRSWLRVLLLSVLIPIAFLLLVAVSAVLYAAIYRTYVPRYSVISFDLNLVPHVSAPHRQSANEGPGSLVAIVPLAVAKLEELRLLPRQDYSIVADFVLPRGLEESTPPMAVQLKVYDLLWRPRHHALRALVVPHSRGFVGTLLAFTGWPHRLRVDLSTAPDGGGVVADVVLWNLWYNHSEATKGFGPPPPITVEAPPKVPAGSFSHAVMVVAGLPRIEEATLEFEAQLSGIAYMMRTWFFTLAVLGTVSIFVWLALGILFGHHVLFTSNTEAAVAAGEEAAAIPISGTMVGNVDHDIGLTQSTVSGRADQRVGLVDSRENSSQRGDADNGQIKGIRRRRRQINHQQQARGPQNFFAEASRRRRRSLTSTSVSAPVVAVGQESESESEPQSSGIDASFVIAE